MSNHDVFELLINRRPAMSSLSKKKSKSVSGNPVILSAFGTSCRKVSKFDVVDPLNCSLLTPGPGRYKDPTQFDYKPKYTLHNSDRLIDQYNTQKFFDDPSASKVVFKRKVKKKPEDLNVVHPAEPSISFTRVSADRKLWEPKNYYHPYKLPDNQNPGPGYYEKHYQKVHASETNWVFKSTNPKFEDIVPRGVGPGSYSLEDKKKLPDCDNFLSVAERITKISLNADEKIAPAPGTYTPYIPPTYHSSSYVFNSGTKRGCQVMPPESAGPGSYNLDKSELHPVSFTKTERAKFDYFKGKEGVGPAHYVSINKHKPKAYSLEFYSDRFYPMDKTGVYIIPEAEDDKPQVSFKEKNFVKRKNNKTPFNSREERFNKSRDLWVKKKIAPDPGYYQPTLEKKIGYYTSKSPRFYEPKANIPGPGKYDISISPLKRINDSKFLNL